MAKILLILCITLLSGVAFCDASCGRAFESKVNAADQRAIVNKHNQLRSLINQGKVPGQPKARGLKNLKWDAALANAAQKIANSCEFKHVKVNDGRFYVGQNLAWGGSSSSKKGADWNGMIQSWFNEYKNFKYPSTSRGVTGHYTQVVWESTTYVGCGYVMYSKRPGWYEKLYVCNYGPGGNYVGQPPYKRI